MNRLKHHYWLLSLFLVLNLQARGTSILPPNLKLPTLADSVHFNLSSVTANVGDNISIPIKVGKFSDINDLTFNVNWNVAYLEFQGVNNFIAPSLTFSNFDLANTTLGRFSFNWILPSGYNAADSSVLFTMNFKVKSYSGIPIPIFLTSPVCYNTGGAIVPVSSKTGNVSVINNGNCAGRPAGLNCETAPLLCTGDFPYCNTLPDRNLFPRPSGCGSIENYHFIQFEAGTETIIFDVKASNCNGGLGGNGNGIQIRIYETTDCSIFRLKYCRSASPIFPNSSDTIEVTQLVAGNHYYLMIDGNTGDVCDYTIGLKTGVIGGKPIIPSTSITGSKAVCKNATGLTYSIPNQAEAIDYTWRVGGGATIVGGQSTPSVSVKWGTVTDSVCVKILGNCGESDWSCQKVEVMDVTPSATKSGDLSCEILSVKLTGSAVASPSNATVTYEWLNSSNTVVGNSSEVNVTQTGVYTLKAKVSLNGNTCEKNTQITVSKTGNLPNRPELQGDVITCDSKAINYNIVNAQSGISKYNWTITNGTINSGATTPSVSLIWGAFASGKICVNAENSCGTSDTTCLNVVINKKPNSVTIAGNQTVCPSSIGTYTASLNENNTTYQWTIPTGAIIKKGKVHRVLTLTGAVQRAGKYA